MPPKSKKFEDEQVDEVANQVMEILGKSPNGLPTTGLQKQFTDSLLLAEAINKCLSTHRITMLSNSDKMYYYVAIDNPLHVGSNEENVVYEVIKAEGNKGIWARNIRTKTNLPIVTVNKILKQLQTKKLIKDVMSVMEPRKKLYMLSSLEPDRSITGGAWYTDSDFESEYVEVLSEQCLRYLCQKRENAQNANLAPLAKRNAQFVPLTEVCDYIHKTGISKVKLSEEDIETLLFALVYDGKVERKVCPASSRNQSKSVEVTMFRAVNNMLPTVGIMRVPCGGCPVIADCSLSGTVNPRKCSYWIEWLR